MTEKDLKVGTLYADVDYPDFEVVVDQIDIDDEKVYYHNPANINDTSWEYLEVFLDYYKPVYQVEGFEV